MEYNKKIISDLQNLEGKRVVLRCDFNVPINKEDGSISDSTRIDSALKTIEYLLDKKAKIILLSHLSRIKTLEDKQSNKKSLEIVYRYLKAKLLGIEISFEKDNQSKTLVEKSKKMNNGSIMLLENTRYADVNDKGEVVKLESKNSPELGKFWASLGDVYVNDAFGTSHRSHASNVGIAKNIKESAIGFLVETELKNLTKAVNHPMHPVIAIFGGAKIADKVESIKYIGQFADKILIGGGMSNNFLKVKGYEIGKSLFDESSMEVTNQLYEEFKDKIVLPKDVVCAESYDSKTSRTYAVDQIPTTLAAFDIGKKTIKAFEKIIKSSKTVIWNGPVGAFENPEFSKGTMEVCRFLERASIKNKAFTVIGGGDSAAAAIKSGHDKYISHISTGGGASLEFFSNIELPGIASIQDVGQDVAAKKETAVAEKKSKDKVVKAKKETVKKEPAKKAVVKKVEKSAKKVATPKKAETAKAKSVAKKPAKKATKK